MTSIKIDRLDGLSSSVAIKGPCRTVATANIFARRIADYRRRVA